MGPVVPTPPAHLPLVSWPPSRCLTTRGSSTCPMAWAFEALSLFSFLCFGDSHLCTRDSCGAVYFSPSGLVHVSRRVVAPFPLMPSMATESVIRRVGFVVSAPNQHWSNVARSVSACPPMVRNQLHPNIEVFFVIWVFYPIGGSNPPDLSHHVFGEFENGCWRLSAGVALQQSTPSITT